MKAQIKIQTRGRRGFTMVEILTVVTILMILITIGVVASRRVGNTGNAQLTRATLSICNQILTETQVSRGETPLIFNPKALNDPVKNQFTTARGNSPSGTAIPSTSNALEIDNGTDYAAHSIQRFVSATFTVLEDSDNKATDPITRIYGSLDDSVFVSGTADVQDVYVNGGFVNKQAYAKEVEHYFLAITDGWGNRLAYKNDPNDLLTGTKNYKHDNFLPKRDSAYFASAGPDGMFGNVNSDPNGNTLQRTLYEAAQDNLYSYEITN